MPALKNPRHEAFAQAILFGLYNSDRETYSNGRAYQRAGYLAKDAGKSGGSAEAAASRLLKKVQPILARVRELQAEHIKHLQPKLDISKERIGQTRQSIPNRRTTTKPSKYGRRRTRPR